MQVSAHDVAREFRRLLPDVGVTVVHKLLYYCQGWNLALSGKPLFGEAIEAWTNGPVVASLWRAERHDEEVPLALKLDDQQLAVVDEVVRRYGHLTARQLSDQTHNEAPWRDAIASTDNPNPPIRRQAVRAHFYSEWCMEQVHRRGNPLPTVDPASIRTVEDLAALSYDERVALAEMQVITDLNTLPERVRIQIDEDARRVARAEPTAVREIPLAGAFRSGHADTSELMGEQSFGDGPE